MTRFPISPLHGEKDRSESFATHARDGEFRDVRRKYPGNPEESQGNPPYIVGWEKCKAKAALYARENGLRDVRHAHGELEFSPGVYERKSDAGSVPRLGQHLHLILGPPGTGKTTRLLGLLGDVLQRGAGTEHVAFVSFTRAARAEARARVLERLAVGEDDLPWFRTIHSAAYRLLGLRREQVMVPSGWRDFAQRYRYRLTPAARVSDDDDPFAMPARTEDDKLRYVLEWARNRRIPLAKANGRCGVHVHTQRVQGFADRLAKFKTEHGLLDFGNMLERVLDRGLRPDVSVAFIDEAQDLSPLQIAVVESWFSGCERVFVAGDDDQAIYTFQGADPAWLLGLERRAHEVEVLQQSHRVPARVHALAARIIRQNKERIAKVYAPRSQPGEVRVLRPEHVLDAVADARSVFVLARNRVFLQPWAKRLLEAGEPFVSEGRGAKSPLDDPRVHRAVSAGARLIAGKGADAAGLRALLAFVPSRGRGLLPHGIKARAERNEAPVTRDELAADWGLGNLLAMLDDVGPVQVLLGLPAADRGYLERLRARHGGLLPEPRFRLATIHATKGREADVVVLVPDMTQATFAQHKSYRPSDREPENRVAYVAVTRARKQLIVVEAQTKRSYPYASFARSVINSRLAMSPSATTHALPR